MMPEQAKPWEMDWSGVKVDATPFSGKAKTTQQDMMLLRDSTAKAEAERNARREYAATRQAVLTMNTGPTKAGYLDAITREPGGDMLDMIGGAIYSPLRAFVSQSTADARDHLKTVSAQTALKGSQMMKGASSDKDTALMRMAGVSDYKGVNENLRLLRSAERESAIEQHRATLKSKWISRFGSISAPGPHGLTYEEAASRQEAQVNRAMDIREKGLPKPPPSKRGRGPVEIDLNGRRVR